MGFQQGKAYRHLTFEAEKLKLDISDPPEDP